MRRIDLFHSEKNWIEVNEGNYEKEVIESKKPVMVEFWGPRCRECMAIARAIHEISERYSREVKFCCFRCPSKFAVLNLGVMSLPTFYFYKEGKIVEKLFGKRATADEVEETTKKLSKTASSRS